MFGSIVPISIVTSAMSGAFFFLALQFVLVLNVSARGDQSVQEDSFQKDSGQKEPTKKTVKEVVTDSGRTNDPDWLQNHCVQELEQFPGSYQRKLVEGVCARAQIMSGCHSEKDQSPIFHYDRNGWFSKGKRILVFGLFHGDEFPAGSVARSWMTRLHNIDPRSTWRVVPILNPDGVKAKSRVNGRGVDLNRNFPTLKWNESAHSFWKKKGKSSPRRFPGKVAASERETRCAIKHLEQFRPDFIVSLHTPYGLLDFDGPQKGYFPKVHNTLPWKRLGHYPGSLGRYMWAERNVPVLTIELKGNEMNLDNKTISKLQDAAGSLAIKMVVAKNTESKLDKKTSEAKSQDL